MVRYTALGLVATAAALLAVSAFAGEGTIAPSAEEIKPLEVGAQIPDVKVKTMEGDAKALRDVVAEKPAALVFYRGGWCPYCTAHLSELRDAAGPLNKLGYQLIGIAPQPPETIAETAKDKDINYTLMSDENLEATKQFGVAFKLPPEKQEAYKGFGVDLVEGALPVPSVYLVDRDGKIIFQHSNPDYKERLSKDALLDAAQQAKPEEGTAAKRQGSGPK